MRLIFPFFKLKNILDESKTLFFFKFSILDDIFKLKLLLYKISNLNSSNKKSKEVKSLLKFILSKSILRIKLNGSNSICPIYLMLLLINLLSKDKRFTILSLNLNSVSNLELPMMISLINL